MLTDLRNRGIKDTFFVVCDGLKGLPEMVSNVWPRAIVQTCIIQLIRNTFRLASRRDWDALKRDVKPIYTAVNATAARAAFDELTECPLVLFSTVECRHEHLDARSQLNLHQTGSARQRVHQ